MLTRRGMLFTAALSTTLRSQAVDRTFSNEVFEAVWTAVRDQFYDPNIRGVNWTEIKKEFAPRVTLCTSRDQLLRLLQDMLRRVHNSHVFLYSREEWNLRQNILPFSFDRVERRVFIRDIFQTRSLDAEQQYRFGDEILSVDQIPIEKLEPMSLAKIQNVKGNPNFGATGSIADVRLRRGKQIFVAKARRFARPQEFENVVLSEPAAGVSVCVCLRSNQPS